jgi:hypothetical protein
MLNFSWLSLGPRHKAERPENLIFHKVPKIPIMIDQIETEPETVREFTGQPLHTVVDGDALEGKMLQIFTTQQKAQEYTTTVKESQKPFRSKYHETTQTVSALSSAPTGSITLYRNPYISGCYWYIPEAGGFILDFRDIWACGFGPFGWINADDIVSSVDPRLSKSLSWTLWESIYLQGSAITFVGNMAILDLGQYGWDDRASSLSWQP